MSKKIHHMPSVPPVVFNARLESHLKTLDKRAEALAKTTKDLEKWLDDQGCPRRAEKTVPNKPVRR